MKSGEYKKNWSWQLELGKIKTYYIQLAGFALEHQLLNINLKFNSWTEREFYWTMLLMSELVFIREKKGHCIHNKTWAPARDVSLGKYC